MAINLSFGNTYGAHNGSSLLETYLDNAGSLFKCSIVCGSGNEGASAGHSGGQLKESGHINSIELAITEYNFGGENLSGTIAEAEALETEEADAEEAAVEEAPFEVAAEAVIDNAENMEEAVVEAEVEVVAEAEVAAEEEAVAEVETEAVAD